MNTSEEKWESMDSKREWIKWNLQKTFLIQKHLSREQYPVNKAHNHCEFCWKTFDSSPEAEPETLKEGYHLRGTSCWICDECFLTFNPYFHWVIDDSK